MIRIFPAFAFLGLTLFVTRGNVIGSDCGRRPGAGRLHATGGLCCAEEATPHERIDRQLVEGLSHIANSIRAGFAMLQAIDAAAQRLQPPLSEEFSRLVADVRLGASLEDSLRRWAAASAATTST